MAELEANKEVFPQSPSGPRPEDSTVTKMEVEEKNAEAVQDSPEDRPSKRAKLDHEVEEAKTSPVERKKGIAPIKQQYLINTSVSENQPDDDAAEASHQDNYHAPKRSKKEKGANTNRDLRFSKDTKGLCSSRAKVSEFSPLDCKFGDHCRFEHDLRVYLNNWKNEDLGTFNGQCPVWEARGNCYNGWKCRFVGSHMEERELPDDRKELRLKEPDRKSIGADGSEGIVNSVSAEAKLKLQKRKMATPKADSISKWLDGMKAGPDGSIPNGIVNNADGSKDEDAEADEKKDNAATYKEPPFLPSEKRRIYFGEDTPVLAPLTTQGNLPFRRLCVSLGASLTYSEMAMSLPLMQGNKSEWALLRAHASEAQPPLDVTPGDAPSNGYAPDKDLRFGAQISGNKPPVTLRATEVLTALCPHLRVIDLNCGCPIDLVYRQGAGSALLDNPARLERMLWGMGAVSGEIPITAKIRTGTQDKRPTALRLVDRLVYGENSALGPSVSSCGVAAITLHGRSRQQRYTRSADWEYIASCVALINRHRAKGDKLADTVREPDDRTQPPGGKVHFLGNGDCYSHEDYYGHLRDAKVDAVMVARGAIVKPWIFEEIEKQQYLDKTATERLGIVEQYVRYGLETWGSDEMGVALTRRFLLEYLSFAHRYIPVGLLEYLPPSLQDRPPAFKGRNEMETLLASDNYKDWIKISEMYLGPTGNDFRFQPKHKSNSYEIKVEG